jgi:predicted nucleic acid-binding Zn ribbon protein
LASVFSRWEEVVGPGAAAHCRPLSLVRGTLVVAVDEPGWATELRYGSAILLARLAEVVGDGVARRVEVRVRPETGSG